MKSIFVILFFLLSLFNLSLADECDDCLVGVNDLFDSFSDTNAINDQKALLNRVVCVQKDYDNCRTALYAYWRYVVPAIGEYDRLAENVCSGLLPGCTYPASLMKKVAPSAEGDLRWTCAECKDNLPKVADVLDTSETLREIVRYIKEEGLCGDRLDVATCQADMDKYLKFYLDVVLEDMRFEPETICSKIYDGIEEC